MYLYIAWILLGKPRERFWNAVRFLLYGDDGVASTTEKDFNFRTVRDVLAPYGIVLTPASKDGSEYDFQEWDDITFLKRSFVEMETPQGTIVACPLDEESIGKMLAFVPTNPVVPVEEQLCYNIMDAQRQYFMYGADVFEKKTHFLKHLVKKHQLPFRGRFEWKSFEELSVDYHNKNFPLGFA